MSIENVKRLLTPVSNKIRSLINRCKINTIDDSGKVQKAKIGVLKNETMNVRRVLNSGFTSIPLENDQAIVIFPNGTRENGYIIGDIPSDRLKNLTQGNTAIYSLTNPSGNNTVYSGDDVKTITKNLEIELDKLKVLNTGGKELITVLVSLIDEIIGARTFCANGPQPLVGQSETFPAIKADLETFKL